MLTLTEGPRPVGRVYLTWNLNERHVRGWLGFTAKIRDATVALAQGNTASRKDDFGFVPLLHLAGEWRLDDRWNFSVDGADVDEVYNFAWLHYATFSIRWTPF